jgi:glycosyltransferase involved in cell wall biosynthesis
MISLALLKSFSQANWDVGFIGFIKPERWTNSAQLISEIESWCPPFPGSLWLGKRDVSEKNLAELQLIVREWKPQIVYCFGFEAAALVNEIKRDFCAVATIYEPPHFGAIQKRIAELRYGNMKARLNILRRLPDMWRRKNLHWNVELPALRKVDILISHSYIHGQTYQLRLKRSLLYFPNPLELVTPVDIAPRPGPPSFLLAGSMASTVSLTGMYFFARRVLPHIIKDLKAARMQIRIVGGGSLRAELHYLYDIPNLHFLGFVSHDDLLQEYGSAIALLVPTPIRLGFRTRIMDAFRYGVPTIVHSANKAGFHELEHRKNTMLADNGRDFAAMMREILVNNELRIRISERALSEFEEHYSVEVFRQLIIDSYTKQRHATLK